MIREWRTALGLSQLNLACNADISARHLSFIETGRALPSREMLLRIASTLEVPEHEQNALLMTAGYAAAFAARAYESAEMSDIRDLVDRMLAISEPYCAAALDRHWNILAANDTYWALTGGRPDEKTTALEPPNLLKRLFAAEAFKDALLNWEEVAYSLIQRLHREAIAELRLNKSETTSLLRYLMTKHHLPQAWQVVDMSAAQSPLIPMDVELMGERLQLITTVTTLGTPLDAARDEIRIETFLPADETSRKKWLSFTNACQLPLT